MKSARNCTPLLLLTAFTLVSCVDPSSSTLSSPTTSTVTTDGGLAQNHPDSADIPTATIPVPSLKNEVTLDAEESAFLGLINDYRAQYGLPALQVSLALTEASKWMSDDMANQNYFSHTDSQGRDPFNRMADLGYAYKAYSGENIAAGNASSQDTFLQWKNSPGHNANMLGAYYRVIGIGRIMGSKGSAYTWYWTTDFGSTVDKLIETKPGN